MYQLPHSNTKIEEIEVEHFWVTWTDAQSIVHDITDMEDSHIRNLYGWLCKRLYVRASVIIRCEIERRYQVPLSVDYETACYDYQWNPETPLLIVHGEPRNIATLLPDKDPY